MKSKKNIHMSFSKKEKTTEKKEKDFKKIQGEWKKSILLMSGAGKTHTVKKMIAKNFFK